MGSTKAQRSPRRRWLTRIALVGASLVVTLVLAEIAVGAWRRNAFPYLNNFVSDHRYGVLLEAGSSTRTVSRDGRVTKIRINERGFRGRPWSLDDKRPALLLLGDSQVFGYGVGEAQSMGVLLQKALDRRFQVLAAGVPSWGPMESAMVAEELSTEFPLEHIVLVANLANDWFEAPVPNTKRTTARHGWALTPSGAQEKELWLPFGGWIRRHSHLWYLVQRLRNHRSERPAIRNTGSWLADHADRFRNTVAPYRSPLGPILRRLSELCGQNECRLSLVVLPVDTLVHSSEWAKYEEVPRSLQALELLVDDLLSDAAALQIPSASSLTALRGASPGAFLPDDYHLSPRGHRVLAQAILDLIDLPFENQAPTSGGGPDRAR